jgi:hypothetical protein
MSTEMELLGFIVGRDGLRVDPEKIEAIKNWPRLANITEIRSFLGLVQFFKRFTARFSEIAILVINLTRNNQSIKGWDDKFENIFFELKDSVAIAPILQSSPWAKPFRGHVDASQLAFGLVMMDWYTRWHSTQRRFLVYVTPKNGSNTGPFAE